VPRVKRTSINVELLRRTFRYDERTGHFYRTEWSASRPGRNGSPKFLKANERVGGVGPSGYWRIGFDGARWLAQSLAWAYMHGVIPAEDIDHINRDKLDNCIENLRVVTRGQNMRNSDRNDRRGVTLGTFQRPSGNWGAQVSAHGQTISLGTFSSQDEANAAHQYYVNHNHLKV
jgi:hypothetical protein